MPDKPRPENPARAVRIHDDLWHDLQAIAAKRGEKVSAVIRTALEQYVRSPK